MANRFIGGVLSSQQPGSGGFVSRASTGTYFNNTGTLVTAPINQPRLNYSYDGTSWKNPAVLLEPASTNLYQYSQIFTSAPWSTGALTANTNVTTAPDGTTTASSLIPTVTNTFHRLNYSATYTNTTYTLSFHAKAAGYNFITIRFDNGNGTINGTMFNLSNGTTSTGYYDANTAAAANTSSSIVAVGNGWYRISITQTITVSTNVGHYIHVCNTATTSSFAGDGTSGVYIWGAQLEQTYGATSYIPTNGSTVTRAQDDVGPLGSGIYTLAQLENQTAIDDQSTVQTFTTVGSTIWTAPADVTSIEVLVVAGGGAGGRGTGGGGGGGGGGGVLYNTSYSVVPGTTYPIVVGAGAPGITTSVAGASGGNSLFGNLIAIGGGGGGGNGNAAYHVGLSGGSGGGAGDSSNASSGALGIAGQGYNGGASVVGAPDYGAGGGGGAGGPGRDGTVSTTGNGGPGLYFNISGTSTAYGGGGGGGAGYANNAGNGSIGIGGAGGGGSGGYNGSVASINATANTGGGGGGVNNIGNTGLASGNGGSGIIIIKYKRTPRQLVATSNAAIVTQKFTVSNSWTAPAGVTSIEVLTVGGGGGGAATDPSPGGGGGGGGVVYNSSYAVTPGTSYSIIVGNGGGGGATGNTAASFGSAGSGSLVGINNLVSNGTFTNGLTGWTDPSSGAEGTFIATNSALIITNTNNTDPPACLYQAITCVIGRTYMVTTTKLNGYGDNFVTNITTGVSTGGGTGGFGNVLYFANAGPQGTLTGTFTAAQTSYYIFLRLNTNSFASSTVTNIGVFDITAGTSVVAYGGGGGARDNQSAIAGTYGSGGGGSLTGSGASGTAGQGFAGGAGVLVASPSSQASGGGGGAGGAGYNGTPGTAANSGTGGPGGPGIPYLITGNLEYYAGGGGGSGFTTYGVGGIGGGANGSYGTAGNNGSPNTGGGAGGGGGPNNASYYIGGTGGSGVVILRYRVPTVATFQDSGSWTCPAGVTNVQALIVAGGGAGGPPGGGGGGAGGLIYSSSIAVTPGQTYPVVVGQGGPLGGVYGSSGGSNGFNSSFANLIAVGGGGGGGNSTAAPGSGGSGGGSSGNYLPNNPGTGIYGQGSSGGIGVTGTYQTNGGGGGAGGAGSPATGTVTGAGGPGLTYSISGTAITYAGGGGGAGGAGATVAGAAGGSGGGGYGGTGTPANSATEKGPAIGTQNTGGGGGGTGNGAAAGAPGGSGIVIIRYYGG